MYVGRFVVVGPDVAAYRVSSRSFPNREIRDRDGTLTVGPTDDAPPTDNPYVEYNCLRTTDAGPRDGAAAVLGNGSQVDPILEKIELGYPARDALAESLLALDYEKDDYDTPRLAGVLDEDGAHVGIVRKDAVLVKRVEEPTLVATYERDAPGPVEFEASAAAEAAAEAYDFDFEHAVCAAGVARSGDGFETAIENGD
ncbi:IMP cyclohydrolase [Salinarchaeum sp. Harcht-Bsk1]|uniref:IMP cyclohydrolase n=1 Tax=Salinarchaeum sp. Harcht-Bsk1 TaxID=1333523 RepID=UPI0003423304|nr:IMP cyclohydrolase [Salinarchaeum sp. Harcht-Bsk1]AGN02122.1 IMP cyclohydrolase [Salinarchaeum sp. Harcht-Bsk1]